VHDLVTLSHMEIQKATVTLQIKPKKKITFSILDDADETGDESFFGEENELISIRGSPIKFITPRHAKAVSAKLMMEQDLKFWNAKSIRSSGLAPTRFNLQKYTPETKHADKIKVVYISSPLVLKRWEMIRQFVFGNTIWSVAKEKDESTLRQKEDTETTLLQGFAYRNRFNNEHQIMCYDHHAKIPVHYMDGCLAHEGDEEHQNPVTLATEDKDDQFPQDQINQKKPRPYQITTIDRNNDFTIWDVQTMRPKVKHHLPMVMSLLVFITKNYVYAGVINGNMIQFMTPKLDINSVRTVPHHIQMYPYI
jgi:hypothetical protein